MKNKLAIIREFLKWGSGFTLQAERDYRDQKSPYFYELTVYGLYAPDESYKGLYPIKLMEKAIKDMKKIKKDMNKISIPKNQKVSVYQNRLFQERKKK